MSYGMLEPEWEPVCECKYDAVHDRMDREDCVFHCDIEEETSPRPPQVGRQKPAIIAKRNEENAA